MRALSTLKRWKRLRRDEVPWDELTKEQLGLANELLDIGKSLILPGDSDWKQPATGKDDYEYVKMR